ncbi:MAG: hypothetical protein M5U10_02760 [Candidatus Methanoperedens sp.]|nr:hypothetical protein [Candidatus Methanoperedens nitroreducens]MDJ1420817.1 hypothetical protein [Candidatus Methanoperedens sp.]
MRRKKCVYTFLYVYKEGVEIPSDYHGVLYLPMDTNNGWQLSLAREIKQVGIEIDLNKVI